MARTCDQIKWPLQKGPTRHSRPTREKKKRKAKEKMGRQHQRVDINFNSSQRAAEDHQRWQKIVADVNSGAPTTLMVAGHRYIKRRFKRSRKVETKVDIKRR